MDCFKSCDFYLSTDIGEICQLVVDELCQCGKKCIGYDKIQDEMFAITCEMASLTNKLDRLAKFKDRIDKERRLELKSKEY